MSEEKHIKEEVGTIGGATAGSLIWSEGSRCGRQLRWTGEGLKGSELQSDRPQGRGLSKRKV